MVMQPNIFVETLRSLQDIFSGIFLKIAISLFIFLIGFTLGNLIGKIIYKFLHDIELNKFFKNTSGIKIDLETIIKSILTYFIYFISLIAALDQLGLKNTILYMFAAAVMIVFILSFFLGIKDFVPNLISGFYLRQKKTLEVGDTIETNNIKGKIIKMDIIQTQIKTRSEDLIYIPNSLLTKTKIKVKKKTK